MKDFKISKSVTIKEAASLEKYFREIDKEDLLTSDEEAQLAERIRAGDMLALERLVRANLRFVVSVAKKQNTGILSLSDFINEGNMGLIKAARKFDERRGFKFISFAVWWIRQSIQEAAGDKSQIIRLPTLKRAELAKIGKLINKFKLEHDMEPTNDTLAEILKIDTFHVDIARETSQGSLRLDSPLPTSSDEEMTLLDALPNKNADNSDKEISHTESLKVEVERALSRLQGKQAEIVKLFFGIGVEYSMTIEAIAERFDLSVGQTRRLKDTAIVRIRNSRAKYSLKAYMGA